MYSKFGAAALLVVVIGLASCSDEELEMLAGFNDALPEAMAQQRAIDQSNERRSRRISREGCAAGITHWC